MKPFLCFLVFACSTTVARAQEPGEPLSANPKSPYAWVIIDRLETVTLQSPSPVLPDGVKTRVVRPRPMRTLPELQKLNPSIGDVLPGLGKLLESAKVAEQFNQLQKAKIDLIRNGEGIAPSHYYDCATVLNLTNPSGSQKAVLFQAGMDVDTDGTDPARKPKLSDYDQERLSASFLPRLSYSWARQGDAVNPFIDYHKTTLLRLESIQKAIHQEAERDPKGPVWGSLKRSIDTKVKAMSPGDLYTDLQRRNYPLSVEDPFIVRPGSWKYTSADPFKLVNGCYGAVIVGRRIYPCFLADSGPEEKCGEASLRICKAINPQSSGLNSPFEGPKATYILFPGAVMTGPPDLAKLKETVTKLLKDTTGIGSEATIETW